MRLGAILAATLLPGLATAQTFTEQASSLLGGVGYSAISASLGDYDNDGDPDILFQGGVSGGVPALQLFRNDLSGGVLAFTRVTQEAGMVGSDIRGWSAAWGDYDGDGRVDVFIGQTNAQRDSAGDLFRNTESGFVNVSASTINDPGFHQNVAWVDIDNDFDLDLMIAMEGPELHELYIQNAEGGFAAVGSQAGIQIPFGTKAYGLAIGDTDGDGDMDMYVSTCRSGGNIRNNFFENRLIPDGVLVFTDAADDNGTQFMDNSYHAEFMDFDDDGDLDLFMIGADGKESKIWRNDGAGAWTDVATILGTTVLPNQGGDFNGAKAVDYDNDGDLDIFAHDHLAANGFNSARALFRNDGNWTFVDVTAEEGIGATNEGAYDSTWGDLDRDGDMDLVAPTDFDSPERIFISNAAENGNRWLHVIPRDPTSKNTRAIGTAIYATIGGRTLRRDMTANAGTFNQSDLPVHFGLGSADAVEKLEVRWLDGTTTVLNNVSTNQYLTIIKGPPPTPVIDEGLQIF